MENPFNELNDRLIRIENILIQLQEVMQPELKEDQDIWLNIQNAANFLQISKATLYGKTSKREIPFYKRGKRIFSKKSN